jgi:hypothetical protein
LAALLLTYWNVLPAIPVLEVKRLWYEISRMTGIDPSRLFCSAKACLAVGVFANSETGIRSADAIPQ